jgi:hypothetical protein|tara:strand:- start:375 stop:701 length:327 start_codon:yes stop_codon:yes gene_type:complete
MGTARGKYAKAISDRSGFAFPYSEMIEEHDGVFVHKSEFEPEHPQEDNPSTHRADVEALKNARPDRSEPVEVKVGQKTFFDQNNTMSPQEQKAVILKATVSGVTVSIS